jgi:hypothetical protein
MDDLEAQYWMDLLPFEEWEQYDKRQKEYFETDLSTVYDMLYDYYYEQEQMN